MIPSRPAFEPRPRKKRLGPLAWLILAIGAGGGVGIYLHGRSNERSLASAVVEAARSFLPDPTSELTEDDPRWDEVLGGRVSADQWRYYQRGKGTTCGIFAAELLARAGAPAVLINRDPPDGSGFRVGEHISRLYQGAKKLGWLIQVKPGQEVELRPGDIYCTVRPNATWTDPVTKKQIPASGEHVGVVVEVGPKDASGARVIQTADGGQTDAKGRQSAARRRRTLKGRALTLNGASAPIAWIVRPEVVPSGSLGEGSARA